jgi:26S proteasome regulatory subunit N5
VRANILSKKILRRTLEEAGFQQCKLKFYGLMIEYDIHENNTLELCRHWMAIFNTDTVKADDAMWRKAIQHAAIFALLSPHSNLQHDLLHTLAREKLLEKEPAFYSLLEKFTTKEVIAYPLAQDELLKQHAVFTQPQRGAEWFTALHTRVTEHNIRVVAAHYERIRTPHLAAMIGLSEEVSIEIRTAGSEGDDSNGCLVCYQLTEASISTLVSDGAIYAKIDRPAKIVSFVRPNSPEEQLTNWSGRSLAVMRLSMCRREDSNDLVHAISADISQLLRLVETTCHLINKENMIHKI